MWILKKTKSQSSLLFKGSVLLKTEPLLSRIKVQFTVAHLQKKDRINVPLSLSLSPSLSLSLPLSYSHTHTRRTAHTHTCALTHARSPTYRHTLCCCWITGSLDQCHRCAGAAESPTSEPTSDRLRPAGRARRAGQRFTDGEQESPELQRREARAQTPLHGRLSPVKSSPQPRCSGDPGTMIRVCEGVNAEG